jgi:hypothetical protein
MRRCSSEPTGNVAVAWTDTEGELWLAYALELGAMLCLVVSGMLDAARPRIVVGWLGLAGVIAAITWAVKGSLLRRSVFLAVAGGAAIALAALLDRLRPKASEPSVKDYSRLLCHQFHLPAYQLLVGCRRVGN